MQDKSLEQRVEELEKKAAALEGRVQAQPDKVENLKFSEIENKTFADLEKDNTTW
jgi:uncharacterized coiled-coil protein SlyX